MLVELGAQTKTGLLLTNLVCSGWVPKSSILPFSDDLSSVKGAKRYNLPLIEEALDEAKIVWEMTDDAGTRFYDRM